MRIRRRSLRTLLIAVGCVVAIVDLFPWIAGLSVTAYGLLALSTRLATG